MKTSRKLHVKVTNDVYSYHNVVKKYLDLGVMKYRTSDTIYAFEILCVSL